MPCELSQEYEGKGKAEREKHGLTNKRATPKQGGRGS